VGRRATPGKVTVTATAGNGLAIAAGQGRRTIAALRAGQSRELRLRVTPNASSARLTVRAQAAHARASRSIAIGRTGPGPTPPAHNPLVGTYWWNFQAVYVAGTHQDNTGFYFVNNTTVYIGLPNGGLPASCTPQPVNASLPVDQQGACLSYVYNPATGGVTIGGTATGSYTAGALTVGSTTYKQLTIEPAGYTTNLQLQVIEVSGECIIACVVTTTNFGLASTGQFYLATGQLGSIMIGTGGTFASSFPPNQTGTYTVNANGSITLHFSDGTTQTHTFVAAGADPATAGIVLDQLLYLPPPPGG
jgi:hypothetical protein